MNTTPSSATRTDSASKLLAAEQALLRPDQPLTLSELEILAGHGVLRPQAGTLFVPATAPDSMMQRAVSVTVALRDVISGPWVATMRTAAWIHFGGLPPQPFIDLAYPLDTRKISVEASVPLRIQSWREFRLGASLQNCPEVLTVGELNFTTLEVTAEHLLFYGETGEDQAVAARVMAECDAAEVRHNVCRRGPKSLKARALKRFDAIAQGTVQPQAPEEPEVSAAA